MIDYIQHVENAIQKARNKESKLTPEVLAIHDKDSCMSSHSVRRLISNICNFEGCNYLECGSWRGSIFCSAIFNNQIKATSVDYWPEIGPYRETRNIFHRNLHSLLQLETGGMSKDLRIINEDCFKFDKNGLKDVNVYLYDADHSLDSQYFGIKYYDDVLADKVIIIVDDWNSSDVISGTLKAFSELNYKRIKEWELPGQSSNWSAEGEGFWNGVYVGVIERKPQKPIFPSMTYRSEGYNPRENL